MLKGLCAFPLTPMNEFRTDDNAYLKLIGRLVDAKVDSICVLGSTGNYAYLSHKERARLIQMAVDASGTIPVMTSIGALRTRDVLRAAEDAQKAGVKALLLAPVSYQPLTQQEVYLLFKTVAESVSVPLCVYENPRVTNFHFSDELINKIAQLPAVASIKLAGGYPDNISYLTRIKNLRSALPERISLGISGDAFAASALSAGCETWYSVIGGLFPQTAMKITCQASGNDIDSIHRQSEMLQPIWELFKQYGSLRVIAAAAAILGLTEINNLPLPMTRLDDEANQKIAHILHHLHLA